MRVLVTGGAGFLGSHLVDALVDRRDHVVVLDNLHRGRAEHIAPHLSSGAVEFVEGDIRDQLVLRSTIRGTELVYHLAAQSNVMGAAQDLDYSFFTNVEGTFNLLKAAAAERVRRVVFASSREVYGDPSSLPVRESAPMWAKNPYGASKVSGEAYCRAFGCMAGLDSMVLRFVNLYGPRDRDRVIPCWIAHALRGTEFELYGGTQVLDFLPVGYAVRALLAAATCDNDGPVNVGSGKPTTLTDLAARILVLTGSTARGRYLPQRELEVSRFVANTARMRSVLGVRPPDDPLDDLTALVEWGHRHSVAATEVGSADNRGAAIVGGNAGG